MTGEKKDKDYIVKEMEIEGMIEDFEWLQKGQQELVETVAFFPISNFVGVFDRHVVAFFFQLLLQWRPYGCIEELVKA